MAGKDKYKYFKIEAHELLENIFDGINKIEKHPSDLEILNGLLREFHTLKSAACMVDCKSIIDLANHAEDTFMFYRDQKHIPGKDSIGYFFEMADGLSKMVEKL